MDYLQVHLYSNSYNIKSQVSVTNVFVNISKILTELIKLIIENVGSDNQLSKLHPSTYRLKMHNASQKDIPTATL